MTLCVGKFERNFFIIAKLRYIFQLSNSSLVKTSDIFLLVTKIGQKSGHSKSAQKQGHSLEIFS